MQLSGQTIINYALIPTAVLQWLFQSPSNQLIWALTIIADEALKEMRVASRAREIKITYLCQSHRPRRDVDKERF